MVLAPAALTAIAMRYLVPSPESEGAIARLLGGMTKEHPFGAVVSFFLLFSLLASYWRRALGDPAPCAQDRTAEPESSHVLKALTWTAAIVGAAALALLVRGGVFQSYDVSTASMVPTLLPGDRVGANRLAFGLRVGPNAYFGRTPDRGDLVVFRNPSREGPPELVKRVIGIPGDRVSMRGGHPVINGWQVPDCDAGTYLLFDPEQPIHGRLSVEFLDEQSYLVLHVGLATAFPHVYDVQPNEVFVLGDNRAMSADSRAWNGGRGAGASLSTVDGRVAWRLTGTHRDGSVDFSHMFQAFGAHLRADGMNTAQMEASVKRCLANPPSQTRVPAPGSSAPTDRS